MSSGVPRAFAAARAVLLRLTSRACMLSPADGAVITRWRPSLSRRLEPDGVLAVG
jgi:hypothetical protein